MCGQGPIAALQRRGIEHIEIVASDNERVAAVLARGLGVQYEAELPDDKIAVVRRHQAAGPVVVMVGDR
jgi:Cu+-exporting ATPase